MHRLKDKNNILFAPKLFISFSTCYIFLIYQSKIIYTINFSLFLNNSKDDDIINKLKINIIFNL